MKRLGLFQFSVGNGGDGDCGIRTAYGTVQVICFGLFSNGGVDGGVVYTGLALSTRFILWTPVPRLSCSV